MINITNYKIKNMTTRISDIGSWVFVYTPAYYDTNGELSTAEHYSILYKMGVHKIHMAFLVKDDNIDDLWFFNRELRRSMQGYYSSNDADIYALQLLTHIRSYMNKKVWNETVWDS